jgi:hypothetical protein
MKKTLDQWKAYGRQVDKVRSQRTAYTDDWIDCYVFLHNSEYWLVEIDETASQLPKEERYGQRVIRGTVPAWLDAEENTFVELRKY